MWVRQSYDSDSDNRVPRSLRIKCVVSGYWMGATGDFFRLELPQSDCRVGDTFPMPCRRPVVGATSDTYGGYDDHG